MDRVVVVGCGGSGKTHLARRLGAALNVKVVHLDSIYYDCDWNPLPQDDFAALQRELVASRGWVIEGNYASTLPIRLAQADTVIFMDLPPWTCLWGLLQRRLRHGRGQHDAIGVYDRITWGFIRYVWTYRRDMRPRVRRLIDEHADQAIVEVLASRHRARRWLRMALANVE